MMSESSKRHSKFLSLIFILKCLSKASVITITLIKSIMYNPDKRFAQKRVTLCPVDNAIKKLYYWFSQYLLAR